MDVIKDLGWYNCIFHNKKNRVQKSNSESLYEKLYQPRNNMIADKDAQIS